jgi:hypothetical protein
VSNAKCSEKINGDKSREGEREKKEGIGHCAHHKTKSRA